MRNHDKVGALVWLILGIAVCVESVRLKLGNFHKPGTGFISFLSGVLLGVCGIILLMSILIRNLSKNEEIKISKSSVRESRKVFLITLVALFGYTILLPQIGFILSTFLFLFVLFEITEPRKCLMPLVLAGSIVILSYLLFSVFLKCQFPRGIFKIG